MTEEPTQFTRSRNAVESIAAGTSSPTARITITTFLAVNFHLLRNVSTVYLGLMAILYLVVIGNGIRRRDWLRGATSLAYWAFIAGSIYAAVISVDSLTASELAGALPRLFFVLPLAYCCGTGLRTDADVRRCIIAYLTFIVIGCLSMPMQLITGPISWFAESSARGGLARYASLFGNLTAVGIVGAVGFLGLILIRGPLLPRVLGALACLIGLVLSLQKAAAVNLVLCVPLYLAFAEGSVLRRTRRFMVGALAIAMVGTVAIAAAGDLTPYAETVGATYLASGGGGIGDDDTITQSLQKRLVVFPQTILHELGPSAAVTGVGLRGMGGVMGMDYYDMAHNTYYDMLFSGGLLYLAAFVAVIVTTANGMRGALRRAAGTAVRENNLRVLAAICTLIFVNLPASSGVLFQPNLSAGVWLTLGLLSGAYGMHGDTRVHDALRSSPA